MALDWTNVSVRFEGLEGALEEIEAREEKAGDLSLAFRWFDYNTVDRFTELQFQTAGTFGQEPWKELAPATKKARRRSGGNRGGVDRPLWDTGTLKGSLDSPGGRALRHFGAQRYFHGTSLGYASFVGAPDGPRPIYPDPWPRFLVSSWEETLSDFFEGSGAFAGI